MSQEEIKIQYEIYDERYSFNPDEAQVLDVCESLPEARETARKMDLNVVILKYTMRKIDESQYEEIASEVVK